MGRFVPSDIPRQAREYLRIDAKALVYSPQHTYVSGPEWSMRKIEVRHSEPHQHGNSMVELGYHSAMHVRATSAAKSGERTEPSALSGPALRSYFRLTEQWGLSSEQERILLGSPSRSTFYRWKRNCLGRLRKDTLERISYMLGIYRALHVLYSRDAQADGWLKRPNTAPLFGGGCALDRMLSGNVGDLYAVRQYLDSQCGGA